jgi:TonB family protein
MLGWNLRARNVASFALVILFCVHVIAVLPSKSLVQQANDGGGNADFVPPMAIHIVSPNFAEKPRKQDRMGEMVLTARVGTDGSVKDVVVVSGDPTLANATIGAVRQWRYLPAMRGGTVIEADASIRFRYNLGRHVCRPEQPASKVQMAPQEDLLSEIVAGEVIRDNANGITPPKPTLSPDPEYSEAARRDRFQGSLSLGVVIGVDGHPRDIWVIRPLGHGLDEQAIRTVGAWEFSPADRNGEPFPAVVTVAISFSLSNGDEPEFAFDLPEVTAPILVHRKDAKYSKEARKNRLQGKVVLTLIVDADGMPRDIRVITPLGSGLDENAIDAVQEWRWQPAMKDGKPISMPETLTINFQLP